MATIHTRSIAHRGTLYVPVASLLRAFGLNQFYQEGPVFIFSSPECRLEIEPGSREARINGEVILMSAPADWVEGKLVVPIYLALQHLARRFPAGGEAPLPPPKGKWRVMLDPGHGGMDPGAVGAGGRQEKEVVMEISRLVKSLLELKGYEVVMTRDDDQFVSLRERSRKAQRSRADIFVSIHANAAFNHLAQGTETFYYAPAADLPSQKLALLENAVLELERGRQENNQKISNFNGAGNDRPERRANSIRLARRIQKRMELVSPGPDRGVKTAEFYVLKYTRMPSVLVETGFLSNRDEGNRLGDLRYREKLAEAIARGIDDYLRETAP